MNAREAEAQAREDTARTVDTQMEEALEHPVDSGEVRGALAEPTRWPLLAKLGENQMLVAITFATALVVGIVASLVVGSWWFLAIALAVHALATLVVVGTILKLTGEQEKPDPVTVARMQEEGVSDPEQKMNEALEQVDGERAERR